MGTLKRTTHRCYTIGRITRVHRGKGDNPAETACLQTGLMRQAAADDFLSELRNFNAASSKQFPFRPPTTTSLDWSVWVSFNQGDIHPGTYHLPARHLGRDSRRLLYPGSQHTLNVKASIGPFAGLVPGHTLAVQAFISRLLESACH